MIATLIGMLLMTQVASSWLVIWKQPSPSIAQTVRVRTADLGAHGRRHGVAHRAEAAGVEPGVGVLVLDELRGPHLVLADAGDVDRVGPDQLAEPADHVLRCERAVVGLGVAQRVGVAPGVELLPPGRVVRPAGPRRTPPARRRPARPSTSLASPTIGTSATRFLEISAGSMSACTIVACGREAGQLAGHPVVEPRAEADDQVGLLQRGDRGHRAVHARACRGARGGSPAARRAPSAW